MTTTYYIPGAGYVNGQFTSNGISYPMNWLAHATPAELDAIGAVAEPIIDSVTQVLERQPGGWSVRDKTSDELAADEAILEAQRQQEKANLVSSCWAHYDAYVLERMDQNDRGQYLFWYFDTTTSEAKRTMVQAVFDWAQTVWGLYYVDQAKIAAGTFEAFSELPECPYRFRDIAFTL